MSKDFYQTLGISKSASEAEIKKAFYGLAQKHHPDKPSGDEAKFKEINEAYQVLSSKEKRAQYDQFGSAGPSGSGGFGGGGGFGGFQGGQGGFDFSGVDLDDILSQAFGFGFGGGGRRARRGQDFQVEMRISFKESVEGVDKDFDVPSFENGQDTGKTKTVKVAVPAGIESGQRLKVRGYGEHITDGTPGDLYISMVVGSHPQIRREGIHLAYDLPVKLTDAILGAKYTIPTLDKDISIKVPAGLRSGQVLRVRGGGVAGRGDYLIYTSIVIPKKLSKIGKKAVKQMQEEGY